MEADSSRALFVRELRRVLPNLYDLSILRRSPLIQLFGLDQRADAVSALQHILTEAIESLRPADNVPVGSNAWRIYRILYYCYIDQFTQCEVAVDLALSTRQVRRQEKIAQEVLADYLWDYYSLDQRAHLLSVSSQIEDEGSSTYVETPSREQELEWLERTIPDEAIKVCDLVQEVSKIIHPLMQTLKVSVECNLPDTLPLLAVQLTTVRQALLYVITMAARYVPGGRVNITAEALQRRMGTHIHITTQRAGPSSDDTNDTESREMARKLIQISGGSLEVTLDAGAKVPFTANIMLPTVEQMPVLVIDDNADTLKLLQRYLTGSRYRFVGTSDPHEALTLVEQLTPDIIVLDVMLPRIDGWELLGRLREHPKTSSVPIIVCTILAQEQLALTLGAAEFIRKPASQRALLSALDRQIDRLLTKSR